MIYLNVEQKMEEKGITRYQIVKQTQSNYNTINHIIDNVSTAITFRMLYQPCKILDCTPGDLFVMDDKEPKL